MSDPITVLSHDPVWSELFRQLGEVTVIGRDGSVIEIAVEL